MLEHWTANTGQCFQADCTDMAEQVTPAYGRLISVAGALATPAPFQDHDGLRRYAHIGTGNYHAGTARLYFDHGILTCDSTTGRAREFEGTRLRARLARGPKRQGWKERGHG